MHRGGERAELHILVPHAEAAKHSLAISHVAVSREREVVVVDVQDRPGVLADLTRKIARLPELTSIVARLDRTNRVDSVTPPRWVRFPFHSQGKRPTRRQWCRRVGRG